MCTRQAFEYQANPEGRALKQVRLLALSYAGCHITKPIPTPVPASDR